MLVDFIKKTQLVLIEISLSNILSDSHKNLDPEKLKMFL